MYPQMKDGLFTLSYAAANAYADQEIVGPGNKFPLSVYEMLELNLTGTLTITDPGSGVPGTPVGMNPLSLIRRIEFSLGPGDGKKLLHISGKDLYVSNMIAMRDAGMSAQLSPVLSGAAGVWGFSARIYVPFALLDMPDGARGFLNCPALRRGGDSVQFRLNVLFGSEEHLISGGTMTKTLSNVKIVANAVTYPNDPRFATLGGSLLNRRITLGATNTNATANTDLDLILLPRDRAMVRSVMLHQYGLDSYYVETDLLTLIPSTARIRLIRGDTDEWSTTWASLVEDNKRRYGSFLPDGYVVLDFSPNGNLDQLAQWTLSGVADDVKIRVECAGIAGFISETVQSYADPTAV